MLGILCVRVLLLDLLMRLDIDIIVEDLELIVLVRLISFIVYLWGVLEDCKLLVFIWIIILFGFLCSNGLIWFFMFCVVYFGKVVILICEFFDILWFCRYLRVEFFVIMIFFWWLGCEWLNWFDELIKLVFCVLIFEDDGDVLCFVIVLFLFWLFIFFLIWFLIWIWRGLNLLWVWVILVGIVFWLCFVFVFFGCGFVMD